VKQRRRVFQGLIVLLVMALVATIAPCAVLADEPSESEAKTVGCELGDTSTRFGYYHFANLRPWEYNNWYVRSEASTYASCIGCVFPFWIYVQGWNQYSSSPSGPWTTDSGSEDEAGWAGYGSHTVYCNPTGVGVTYYWRTKSVHKVMYKNEYVAIDTLYSPAVYLAFWWN